MAKIQFLTILLTVTCFLGCVVSVTDKNIEDRFELVDLHLQALSNRVDQLEVENKECLPHCMLGYNPFGTRGRHKRMVRIPLECILVIQMFQLILNDSFQNTTIEERVALLEIQVADIEGDISVLIENDNFLFDEQVIQDERIFILEQTSIETSEEVEALQVTTISLDFRVTVLEENGGDDGNSSVAELEVRVETLEGTAADHETRISASETDLTDLEGAVADQETRLTAAEENIQGLQMTDVELDERVTALEENDGGGNNQNDTIAFNTVLTSYSSIPVNSAVLFNEVLLNEGVGYDSSTGTFTVPEGGDGFYYFSVYFVVWYFEYAYIDIQINGETICTAYADRNTSDHTDPGPTSCSAVTFAAEDDTVQVVYRSGTDTTPLIANTSWYYNGFTGFRI